MNKRVISISGGKITFHVGLYDFLICLLMITSLAFYDKKIIFLGTQLITFAYAVAKMFIKGTTSNAKKYLIWLVVFSSYGAISILWASNQNSTAFSVTLSVIQVGLICFCIIDYCIDKVCFLRAIQSFLIACILLCVRFFSSIPISLWGKGDRLSRETIFGTNTPAMVLAYGAILALWMFLENKCSKSKKILLLIEIISFMFVSMMAGTRKGIIAFLVALIAFLLMRANNLLSIFARIFAIVAIIVGVYIAIMNIPVLYGSIGYRIESMIYGFFGMETDKSFSMRLEMIKDAFGAFLQHPILGIGQDGYRYINPYMFTYSHNNYVELLVDLGILGFGLFYSMYIWLFCKCRQIGRSGVLSMCILIVTLIMDFGNVGYTVESTYVLVGIAFGAFEYAKKEKENCYVK